MASKYRVDMVDHALRPEVVLSEENKKNCIKQFQSYDLPKVHGESIPEAAVLVPLCMYKGELGFLYTLRSIKLTSGRGQVGNYMCFFNISQIWNRMLYTRILKK